MGVQKKVARVCVNCKHERRCGIDEMYCVRCGARYPEKLKLVFSCASCNRSGLLAVEPKFCPYCGSKSSKRENNVGSPQNGQNLALLRTTTSCSSS